MHLSILLITLFAAATAHAGPVFTSSPSALSQSMAIPSRRDIVSPPQVASHRSFLSSPLSHMPPSCDPLQEGRMSRFAHRPPVVLSESPFADSPPADLLIDASDEENEPGLPMAYPPPAPSSDGHLADTEASPEHPSSDPMSDEPSPVAEMVPSNARTLRRNTASQNTLRRAKTKRTAENKMHREKSAGKKTSFKRDKLPLRGLDMNDRQDSCLSVLSSSSGSTSTPVALRGTQRPLSFTRLLSFERDATGRPQWGGVKQAVVPATDKANADGSNKMLESDILARQHELLPELLAQKEAFYNALLEQKWRKMDRLWRDAPVTMPQSLVRDKEMLESMLELLQDKRRHDAQMKNLQHASHALTPEVEPQNELYWSDKAGQQPLVLTAQQDGELAWAATESDALASRRKRPLSRHESDVWSLVREHRPVKKRSSINLSMPTSRLDHIVDEGNSPALDHEEREWQWSNVKKKHYQKIFSDDEGMFREDPVREAWVNKLRQQIEILEFEEENQGKDPKVGPAFAF